MAGGDRRLEAPWATRMTICEPKRLVIPPTKPLSARLSFAEPPTLPIPARQTLEPPPEG
jgi:hypothetical protein